MITVFGTLTYTPTATDTGCSEGIQDTDTAWNNKIVNNTINNSAKEALTFSGLGNTVTGNHLDACGQSLIGGAFAGCIAWEKSSQAQPATGMVTTNVAAVTWSSGYLFQSNWAGQTIIINSVSYAILSVSSSTSLTLTASAGVQASPVNYSTASYVGDTVIANNVITNTAPFVMRYGIQVLFTGTASYALDNMTIANNSINGAGNYTGGSGILNAILLNANTLTGAITLSNFHIYGNAIFGNVTNPFNPVSYSNISGRAIAGIDEFLQASNTQSLNSDVAITATTPGTVVFTWGSLPLSAIYSFHCGILYSQATAVAANGIAVQGANASPVRLDAWGKMDTSNAYAGSAGSALSITSTTATSVVTATPGLTSTVYQASLDGTIQANNLNATTLNVLVFTGNGADVVTVKAGSYCRLMP